MTDAKHVSHRSSGLVKKLIQYAPKGGAKLVVLAPKVWHRFRS